MGISQYGQELRAIVGTDLLQVIGAGAFVVDDQDRLLLHRRSDNGLWSIPGGACDPFEEPAQACVREVREETGIECRPLALIGVFSSPDMQFAYPNGDQVSVISTLFLCEVTGGSLQTDNDESLEVRFFPLDALPDSLVQRQRSRIAIATRFLKTWRDSTNDPDRARDPNLRAHFTSPTWNPGGKATDPV